MSTRYLLRRGGVLPAVLALAAFAAGCAAVGPNYKRPELAPPIQYRGVQGAAAAESLADLPWWQVFDAPTLQALIREGIGNNLDLKVASARVVESRALAGVAKSFLYPQVGIGFGASGDQVSRLQDPPLTTDKVPDRSSQNWAFNATVSWEVDLFGRIRRGKESAFAQYLATEEGRRGVLVTLVGDIASAYFSLQELDLELEIARRTLKINDDSVVYYQTRLAGGVSNRLEVDQAKANRAVTATAIPDIEQQIALTENALSVLLGHPPSAITRGQALVERKAPPSIPAGLPAQLLARRPDVVQAEQLLVASNADVGAAKALFYPTISLTGSAGSISGALSDFMRPDAMVWSLAAGIFQPIYAGGRIKQNYEAAKARFDQALAAYQKAALSAYRDVADSLVTIEKLTARRKEIETGVDALRDATQLARSRYENGLSSYIEVLLADQQLFQQERLLAQTRGAQLTALAQFYRSLGGGWQPEQPAAPPVK